MRREDRAETEMKTVLSAMGWWVIVTIILLHFGLILLCSIFEELLLDSTWGCCTVS